MPAPVGPVYGALRDYLESGGGDGLFEKAPETAGVTQSPDDQGDYPFQFKPPLPWRFTTSGTHTTAKLHFKDRLFFSVGVDGHQSRFRPRILQLLKSTRYPRLPKHKKSLTFCRTR